MGIGERFGRGKDQGSSKAEQVRVLVGEPFNLDPMTRVEVQALCGTDLKHARQVSLNEVTLEQHERVTKISPSDQDPENSYLLEPGEKVVVNKNSDQLASERGIAACRLIQDYSVLEKVVRDADPAVISLGQILEVHLRIVEASSR